MIVIVLGMLLAAIGGGVATAAPSIAPPGCNGAGTARTDLYGGPGTTRALAQTFVAAAPNIYCPARLHRRLFVVLTRRGASPYLGTPGALEPLDQGHPRVDLHQFCFTPRARG